MGINKKGVLLVLILVLPIIIIASSKQAVTQDIFADYKTNIDLNTARKFTVGDFSLELKSLDNFVKLIGVNEDKSKFFSYRFDSPPSETFVTFATDTGEKKEVLLSNIPEAKNSDHLKNEAANSYVGKIQGVLLEDTREKEIPVIITLDIGKYMDLRLENLEKNQPLMTIEGSEEAFLKSREELLKELQMDILKDSSNLRLVNAVATKLTQSEIKELEDLDIVTKVSFDSPVHIVLYNSTEIINATSLWHAGNNITGKGITIAIIDTGVDYTHVDLGGCLGEDCKVLSGYDFVNQDSDPIDDHGHGTHCAGTAAGNGTMLGVAPNAKIYAYKVLSDTGSGSTSWVIGGIERALDPDNDGDYSDHADVISLSLGGSGNPDDELSQAVNAATVTGAVMVVAAGNSGPYAESIGSPGGAEKAITVGATCKPSQIGDHYYCDEKIASFSSRGPTSTGSIKPDIVAPGVLICAAQWGDAWASSQCFDNDHTAISGTSMATPHVAGAAALLLQSHVNWTPEQVKSALMTTSTNLGYNPNFQGTGEINVLLAENASFSTQPQSLGFGFVNNNDFATEFKIINLKNTPVTLTLSVADVIDEESNTFSFASLNTTSINLPGGNSTNITLEINITGNAEGNFFGMINITYDNYVGRMPFSFVKLSQLTITVNGSQAVYPDLLIHDENLTIRRGVFQGIAFEGDTYTFQIPSGNYTVYAVGDQEDLNYEYLLMGIVEVPINSHINKTLNVSNAREFTVGAESLTGEPLKLYKWEKGFVSYYLGETLSYSFVDPEFGNRTIRISNKPDNQVTTDIIINYHGVPTDSAYTSGGNSRSIGT